MNLTCPSCDTTFRVDPALIGPTGRRVRCGSCGHDWHQPRAAESEPQAGPRAEPRAQEEPEAAPSNGGAEPEAAIPSLGPATEAEGDATVDIRPEARDRERKRARAAPPPRPAGNRTAVGWLSFLLVVALLGAGLYFGRTQIVAAVPAAAELYRMAGLPHEPPLGEGLELREVKSVRRLIDGQRVVVIEGLVANVSDRSIEVPKLRASVTDATGTQIEEWVFSARDGALPPGGITQFETSTRNAPREGSLGIDFVAVQ